MTNILDYWKDFIVEEEFNLMINFITNKINIPELNHSILVIIGEDVDTLKLLLDIQQFVGPDDSEIDCIDVLNKNTNYVNGDLYQLSEKKLVMFETGNKVIDDQISRHIKYIVFRCYDDMRFCVDENEDESEHKSVKFDIIITTNFKDSYTTDEGIKRRSKIVHLKKNIN